jgi:hypothetical protein
MSMFNLKRTVWIFLASGTICGCGSTSDEDRLKHLVPDAAKTVPVHGKVLVDGEPVKGIWVKLHSHDELRPALLPKAQTDADGTFKITTYIGGDGAPQGHYKVTVEWLTFQPVGGRWVGPNKVDNKFSNMKTSPFEVTVGSEPVTLPTFEVEANVDGDLKKGPEPHPKQKKKRRRQ